MAFLKLEGHAASCEPCNIHVGGGVLVAPDLVLMTANCVSYSFPPDLRVPSAVQRDQGETPKEEEGVLGAPGRIPCQRRKILVCRRVLLLIYNFNLLLVYDFN